MSGVPSILVRYVSFESGKAGGDPRLINFPDSLPILRRHCCERIVHGLQKERPSAATGPRGGVDT